LKSEVLVKAKIEDPDVLEGRKTLVQSKSVGELSRIHTLADFPIPSSIQRMISRSKPEVNEGMSSKK
jgi:hypothetical protein